MATLQCTTAIKSTASGYETSPTPIHVEYQIGIRINYACEASSPSLRFEMPEISCGLYAGGRSKLNVDVG